MFGKDKKEVTTEDRLSKDDIRLQYEKESLLKEFLDDSKPSTQTLTKEDFMTLGNKTKEEFTGAMEENGSPSGNAYNNSADNSYGDNSNHNNSTNDLDSASAKSKEDFSNISEEEFFADLEKQINEVKKEQSSDLQNEGSDGAKSNQGMIDLEKKSSSVQSEINSSGSDINSAGVLDSENNSGNSNDSDSEFDNTVIVTNIKPMPSFGKGFIFIPIIVLLTAAGVVLGHIHPISYGIPTLKWLRYLYIGFGIIILFYGVNMMSSAVNDSKLFENVTLGKLITTGIYEKTRNPFYGGMIFISLAILFFSGNTFMYVIPPICWLLLKLIMKKTEEELLIERFGVEYMDYMKRTNCFVPLRKKEQDSKSKSFENNNPDNSTNENVTA